MAIPMWMSGQEPDAVKRRLGEVVRALADASRASRDALNLVPSENRLSPMASSVLGTDFYHRYFFNDGLDPGFWQFRGGQSVGFLETELTKSSLGRLAGAELVNVRPISGMSAMVLALSGLGGPPGGHVLCIHPDHGGHYATGSVARRLGFGVSLLPVRMGAVDDTELRTALRTHRPKLVYLDLQNSRQILDVTAVVEAVRAESPSTLVHVDCSHSLGLILGGAHPNPLDDGADTIGGSTHKTFPGPHKGVLMTRRSELARAITEAQFTLLSSHHFAETLALGVAATEFTVFGGAYAAQTVANARRFETGLAEAGFDVVLEGGRATKNHQVWVRIGDAAATDAIAGALYEGQIRVNVQVDLPGVPGPALRLGVNELTFTGAREESMELLVQAFMVARDGDAGKVARLAQDIREAAGRPFWFEPDDGNGLDLAVAALANDHPWEGGPTVAGD
ncbi:hypothetical protein [Micromonospora sp. C95]|uniref:hypothetical protein n=1 Tax=Micromonospora sp. C95 TaxID=2824882 RepID=UPI001B39256A|nr:hypothetical protein [Micromonospora sp. C95]MBQ1026080.1 hypothetical protein [Micromonospora sp. C95]